MGRKCCSTPLPSSASLEFLFRWIVGVLHLETSPSMSEIKTLVTSRLFKMSRFRSVLHATKKTCFFEELEESEIDWDYHLTSDFEDQVITEEELLEHVGKLYERKLDVSKPLWRLELIPKVLIESSDESESGEEKHQAVLVFTVNHALGDGVSTIGVLFNLIDDSPIDPTVPLSKQLRKRPPSKVPNTEEGGEGEEEDKIRKRTEMIIQKRKKKPGLSIGTRISVFFGGAFEGLFGILGKHDPHNSFKLSDKAMLAEDYSGEKQLARTAPINLEDIKAMKRKLENGTVNDVLLTILTMTVKAYMEEIDDPMLKSKGSKALLRGSFPVSLRKSNEPILKGNNPSNKWQPLAFKFPFDYRDPIDCFWKVKHQIDRAKVSPQLVIQELNAATLYPILPRDFMLKMLHRLVTKSTAQLSNVPGPQKAIYLLGRKVEDINFYLFAPIGLYMGLLTYNGKVYLSLNMDATLEADPKEMAKHWKQQYLVLKKELNKYPDVIPQSKSKRAKQLKKNLAAVAAAE